MRQFINKYGAVIVTVIVVLAGLSYWLFGTTSRNPAGNTGMAFFVDEETGDESIHPIGDLPPLPGKSGKPTVVRAMKYSCDGGKNSKTRYLVKFTPEAQSRLKTMAQDDVNRPDVMARGEMVRSPEKGSSWYPATSTEGAQLRTLPDCPSGQTMVLVTPR